MESSKEERVKWKADAELMEAKDPQQIPSQDNHDQCMARYVVNVHLLVDSSDFEDMLSRHLDMVGLLSFKAAVVFFFVPCRSLSSRLMKVWKDCVRGSTKRTFNIKGLNTRRQFIRVSKQQGGQKK